MSSKVSAIAVVGLSAVCLGLLWNQNKPVENPAAGTPESKPVVEKFGKGTASVSSREIRMFPADEFKVHFQISQKNKDKNKALTRLEESREKIQALFEKQGIEKKNYEHASVNIRENRKYINKKQVLDGFVADQSFDVYFSNKEKVMSLEQELAALPFVESVTSTGRLKNAEAMEQETIKAACKKAMQRADEYAHSVGAKVGTVVTVGAESHVFDGDYSDSVRVRAAVEASIRLLGKNQSKNAFITVNQEERKKFLADKFVVTPHIYVDGKDKEQVYKMVAEKRTQIENLAKDLGVATSEIDVHAMQIRKKTEWELRNPEEAKDPIVASQEIVVSFVSKDGAAAFYSALPEIEDVLPGYPEPTLRNEDSLRVEVTNIAGKKAMARAKALAEGFGGKLGDVVNVSDHRSYGYDALDEVVFDDAPTNGVRLLSAGARAKASDMNIADSVEISSFISVVTELKY